MIAIIAIAAAVIVFELAGIQGAINRQTRELRAIAEQEAEERRNRGLDANIAARWSRD